jgi:hypothetical protein
MKDYSFFNDRALTKRHYDSQETSWLIEGLIAKQTITLIYAGSGVGKSYLAQAIAKRLAPQTKLCAYIDYENRIAELKKRGVDRVDNLRYLHRATLKSQRYAIVAEMAALANAGYYEDALIILDGAKHFVEDIENDRRVREMINALLTMRDDGATILIIHHTNKSGGNYQGSKELIDGADNALTAKKCISPLGFIGVSLSVGKCRDAVREAAYLIGAEGLSLEELPEAFASADETEQTLALQIVEELKRSDKPLSLRALETAFDRSRGDRGLKAVSERFEGLLWERREGLRGQAFAFRLVSQKTGEYVATTDKSALQEGKSGTKVITNAPKVKTITEETDNGAN